MLTSRLRVLLALAAAWSPTENRKYSIFSIESILPCQNDRLLPTHFVNATFFSVRNVLTINAKMVLSETVRGPISLAIQTVGCNMAKTRCSSFPSTTIRDICKELDTKLLGDKFIKRVSPPMRCPLTAGVYSLNEMQMNLSEFARIPFLEGRLSPTFRWFHVTRGSKKRELACLEAQFKMSTANVKKPYSAGVRGRVEQ